MLISHESPLCLLEESRKYNDYDYALVHLFSQYPKYYKFFQKSLKLGRKVILDNSIFELGKSFSSDAFAYWIEELRPTEYVVPDVLENCDETIRQFEEWKKKYSNLPGIKIGVIQGKTYKEIVKCYEYMCKNADKIAISFDYSYYLENYSKIEESLMSRWQRYSLGRYKLISDLLYNNRIDKTIPHHLLGASTPNEFQFYKDFSWIESIDTSNPIVHAILGIKYEEDGLFTKKSIKLVDLLSTKIENIDREKLNYNLKKFREFCS